MVKIVPPSAEILPPKPIALGGISELQRASMARASADSIVGAASGGGWPFRRMPAWERSRWIASRGEVLSVAPRMAVRRLPSFQRTFAMSPHCCARGHFSSATNECIELPGNIGPRCDNVSRFDVDKLLSEIFGARIKGAT